MDPLGPATQGRRHDLEAVQVEGFDPRVIRDAYGAVADEYVAAFGDDLADLDLDRRLLDLVVEITVGRGPVVDVGCGPGQIAHYLAAHNVDVVGVDFTPAMLVVARERGPGFRAVAADMRALPIRTNAVAGVTAFYVVQHLPRAQLPHTLRELRRVLALEGVLLLAVHAGDGEFQPAHDVTATRYGTDELTSRLQDASFRIQSVEERDPLPHEHQGSRVYVMARAD